VVLADWAKSSGAVVRWAAKARLAGAPAGWARWRQPGRDTASVSPIARGVTLARAAGLAARAAMPLVVSAPEPIYLAVAIRRPSGQAGSLISMA